MDAANPHVTWTPSENIIRTANISQFMQKIGIADRTLFHRWTVDKFDEFWAFIAKTLGIIFKKDPERVCELDAGLESPRWFSGALLNIVDSCFRANSEANAIIYQENNTLRRLTFGELNQLSNRIANSLIHQGFQAGDAIAIAMPMNHYAVAIYLGIIKMGGVVVSIADSFSGPEMAIRLKIAKAKGIFTQDYLVRGSKRLDLFTKIIEANAPSAIVLSSGGDANLALRPEDNTWDTFLQTNDVFLSFPCDPMSPCNILFSSGTTGEPKAIPWNHSTAIKAASDAFFHQNIQPGDVLAWPTNLGWMMGPWLVFAAFINQASIALYTDVPRDRAFGEFVQNAQVTMLGVIPTLVGAWRQTKCMENLNWEKIKVFSSTGECSNPVDMSYLMMLAGNKPVIEYCGGTEIGGAYVSSTVIEPNYPSQFSTPTMGLDFVIIDEQGHEATEGEVAIIPPSVGLSTILLNADHHHVYFENMPRSAQGKLLRRHGDQIKQLPNGYYAILGRVDDTMNLGGIKISAAEIERALSGLTSIQEVAAIAVSPPDNGPSLLVIYAVANSTLIKSDVLKSMQQRINERINPLFRIHDIVFVSELPKTASNKIMRRMLRKNYSLEIKS